MAHPKRKQSKQRTAKRRTHYKAALPTLAICSNSVQVIFTTPYVLNVVITEENLLSKKP